MSIATKKKQTKSQPENSEIGALSGVAAGAAIGSFLGPLGAAAGAIVGGVAGAQVSHSKPLTALKLKTTSGPKKASKSKKPSTQGHKPAMKKGSLKMSTRKKSAAMKKK